MGGRVVWVPGGVRGRITRAIIRAAAEGLTFVRSAGRRPTWRETTLIGLVVLSGVLQTLFTSHDTALGDPPLMAVFTVLTGAVLLARPVRPAAALVAAGPLLAGNMVAGFLCVPVVAFTAARQLPPSRLWRAVAATSATTLVVGLALLGTASENEPWYFMMLAHAAAIVLMIVVPAGCGALLGHRRPAGRLLRERNAYLERTRELTAAGARIQERARIAGEMHDMLGHRLSLLSMHAGALEVRTAKDAPWVSEHAILIRATAGTALAELRQILELTQGPGVEAPLGGSEPVVGTRADVLTLVERSREAGFDVELAWSGEDLIGADPRTRQAVHRVVREGLTNVLKHAPTTTSVRVDVAHHWDRVLVTVSNAAAAAPPRRGPGTRRGLVGLEERAWLIGGTCTSRVAEDGGFVVQLDVPAQPEAVLQAPSGVPATGVPRSAVLALEPPPVRDADLMSGRRFVALLALAVPLAFFLLMLLIAVVFVIVIGIMN